jgi:hypothetical protein
MTLGNTRELGVQNLLASCLNDAYRHSSLTGSIYAASDRSFRSRRSSNFLKSM